MTSSLENPGTGRILLPPTTLERKRERERERETDRQTDRQTERDRLSYGKREKEREREREIRKKVEQDGLGISWLFPRTDKQMSLKFCM